MRFVVAEPALRRLSTCVPWFITLNSVIYYPAFHHLSPCILSPCVPSFITLRSIIYHPEFCHLTPCLTYVNSFETYLSCAILFPRRLRLWKHHVLHRLSPCTLSFITLCSIIYHPTFYRLSPCVPLFAFCHLSPAWLAWTVLRPTSPAPYFSLDVYAYENIMCCIVYHPALRRLSPCVPSFITLRSIVYHPAFLHLHSVVYHLPDLREQFWDLPLLRHTFPSSFTPMKTSVPTDNLSKWPSICQNHTNQKYYSLLTVNALRWKVMEFILNEFPWQNPKTAWLPKVFPN